MFLKKHIFCNSPHWLFRRFVESFISQRILQENIIAIFNRIILIFTFFFLSIRSERRKIPHNLALLPTKPPEL